jgi:large subunit ribosomal protein L6
MSRIGKKPIAIPSSVTLTLDGQTVSVKGPKGQLSWTVIDDVVITHENGELTLAPRDDSQRARSMWGLSRTLVGNMVQGVTDGFERKLELNSPGGRHLCRAEADRNHDQRDRQAGGW